MAIKYFVDHHGLLEHLTRAGQVYEKTAPTVNDYLDDLYIRLNESPDTVVMSELTFVASLLEEGQWMQPNYAANRHYHLMNRLGRDTTGLAGF
jgi:hypothetical protein